MKGKSYLGLPEGYCLIREIDLQKEKKLAIWLNIVAGILGLAMMLPAVFLVKASYFTGGGLLPVLAPMLVFLLGAMVYLALHEWVHGIFIRMFCGKKASYGFSGLYAFAGKGDAFFCKKHYIIISLAPVILLGIALAALNCWAQGLWFFAVYLIQAVNLSGAVGDLYVVYLCLRAPADLLVNDEGTSMRFYTADGENVRH